MLFTESPFKPRVTSKAKTFPIFLARTVVHELPLCGWEVVKLKTFLKHRYAQAVACITRALNATVSGSCSCIVNTVNVTGNWLNGIHVQCGVRVVTSSAAGATEPSGTDGLTCSLWHLTSRLIRLESKIRLGIHPKPCRLSGKGHRLRT
ncbi:hypothetical protein EVAR_49025_1 [Eumeta japonica]|uniref:Uncharacterized protein n=1 Tax=Eumeta variegata TaxID=151549 RepID=A0A4C1XSN8_EUMVA|nr:hypothetical protein EVAR_49025_1 [Eumeta japonica]